MTKTEQAVLPALLEFNITDTDIANGVRLRSRDCPAALALYRQYPGFTWGVSQAEIIAWGPTDAVPWVHGAYKPSALLIEFISNFDSYGRVPTGTYTAKRVA